MAGRPTAQQLRDDRHKGARQSLLEKFVPRADITDSSGPRQREPPAPVEEIHRYTYGDAMENDDPDEFVRAYGFGKATFTTLTDRVCAEAPNRPDIDLRTGMLFVQHIFHRSAKTRDAAAVLKCSPSTVTRTLDKVLQPLAEAAARAFIGPIDSQAGKCAFRYKLDAVAAIGILFIPAEGYGDEYRNSAIISAKNGARGWKVPIAVAPNEICVGVGEPRAGRVSDKQVYDESSIQDDTIYVAPGPVSRQGVRTFKEKRYPAIFAPDFASIGKRPYHAEAICHGADVRESAQISYELTNSLHKFVSKLTRFYAILNEPFRYADKILPDVIVLTVAMMNARRMIIHANELEAAEDFVRSVPQPVTCEPEAARATCPPSVVHPKTAWSVLRCGNSHHLSAELDAPENWKQDLKIHDVSPSPGEQLTQEEQVEASLKIVYVEKLFK
jgi:hypothetical protein